MSLQIQKTISTRSPSNKFFWWNNFKSLQDSLSDKNDCELPGYIFTKYLADFRKVNFFYKKNTKVKLYICSKNKLKYNTEFRA